MTHRKNLSPEAKARARDSDRAYNAAHKEQQKAWREANKEHLRAKNAEYGAANRERLAVYQRDWRANKQSPESKANLAAWRKEYESKNRERIAARKSAWRKGSDYHARYNSQNRERLRAIKNNYRARRRNAEGSLSIDIVDRLMRLQRGCCINCRRSLLVTGHHLDHNEPLARGGANSDENVQLLCPRCNTKKRHTDPIEWAQRNGRLL